MQRGQKFRVVQVRPIDVGIREKPRGLGKPLLLDPVGHDLHLSEEIVGLQLRFGLHGEGDPVTVPIRCHEVKDVESLELGAVVEVHLLPQVDEVRLHLEQSEMAQLEVGVGLDVNSGAVTKNCVCDAVPLGRDRYVAVGAGGGGQSAPQRDSLHFDTFWQCDTVCRESSRHRPKAQVAWFGLLGAKPVRVGWLQFMGVGVLEIGYLLLSNSDFGLLGHLLIESAKKRSMLPFIVGL